MRDIASSDFLTAGQAPRIGVLVNPLSGGNRRRGTGATRQIIDAHAGVRRQDVTTPSDVRAGLVHFAGSGVNLVVVSGGDGTVQAVLTALFHDRPFGTQPLLMLLSSGTTSMTAGDVGVSGNPERALARLFRWARTGEGPAVTVQRPVLRLQVPGHDVQYGMFLGAAGVCQGIEYYHRALHHGNLWGKPGIVLTVIRYLYGAVRKRSTFLAPSPIVVSLDGQPPHRENHLLLMVTTLERLFFGLRPFWGRGEGPLRYTAVHARPAHLLRTLPFLAMGRNTVLSTVANGYDSRNPNTVRLYLRSSIALDGQVFTPVSEDEPCLVQSGGRQTFLRI